ncbi:EamA family transporter [Sneathiella litorea]|uniref:EamA family transporter n=1 Tax=Sneathiella litorea TaxID=2606216 RepID=A0A6L8W9Z1_9PROT|nr:EamA family transporter [Sneathiella litorea]MZR31250.1 EamA family transporter [Sneathiella litorea]
MSYSGYWQFWALLAAVFAALTAILAKVGVSDVNVNFATFLRTVVVVVALAFLLLYTGEFNSIGNISGKSLIFLTLSGLATGASWLCYFRALQIGKASQVAPVDKLSVVFVAIIAALFLGENLSAPAWVGVGMIAGGAILISVS